MKKFYLNVATRLIILSNLPEKDNIINMITSRNIRNKINFSSEEIEKLKLKNDNNRITWLPENKLFEVEFSETEINLLKDIINKLDTSKNITDNLIDFIENLNN